MERLEEEFGSSTLLPLANSILRPAQVNYFARHLLENFHAEKEKLSPEMINRLEKARSPLRSLGLPYLASKFQSIYKKLLQDKFFRQANQKLSRNPKPRKIAILTLFTKKKQEALDEGSSHGDQKTLSTSRSYDDDPWSLLDQFINYVHYYHRGALSELDELIVPGEIGGFIIKLRELDPSGNLEQHYTQKLFAEKLLEIAKNLALLSVYGVHYSALAKNYFQLSKDKGCQKAQSWLDSCYSPKSN